MEHLAMILFIGSFVLMFVLVTGLAGAVRKAKDRQYQSDYRRRRRLENEVDRDLDG